MGRYVVNFPPSEFLRHILLVGYFAQRGFSFFFGLHISVPVEMVVSSLPIVLVGAQQWHSLLLNSLFRLINWLWKNWITLDDFLLFCWGWGVQETSFVERWNGSIRIYKLDKLTFLDFFSHFIFGDEFHFILTERRLIGNLIATPRMKNEFLFISVYKHFHITEIRRQY